MTVLLAQDFPIGFVLIFIVVAVIAIIAGYFSHKVRKQRRADLATLAAKLGCTFDPSHDRSHDDRYGFFEVFRRGHSRAAYNTIQGPHSVGGRSFPLRMGDYTYKITSSNGKTTSTRTYRLSYLILHLPYHTPDLSIRREGVLDKIAGALGFDDIDFESEAFSRRFHVTCKDRKFAFAVVHPGMMEYLMAGDAPPLAIVNGCVCLTDGTRTWTPAEFESRLAWLSRFFELWPDYLTTELDGQPR